MRSRTEFIRRASCPEDGARATSIPIWQTATFALDDAAHGYDYSRSGNPTRRALEERLAVLERGERAFAFASGMAAIAATSSLVPSGGRAIVSAELYGGTVRLLDSLRVERGLRIDYVDTTDVDAVVRALDERADLLLIETPSNPRLRVTDIAALSALARKQGAILAVDNSLLSPWLQNPLDLGADLVLHSATKFLGGHGDLTAGAIILRADDIGRKIGFQQNATGTALSPFESWLLMRGLDTLPLRVERQQENAREVVAALRGHPALRALWWLEDEAHPGQALHRVQARGPGSVLAFELADGDRADQFLRQLEYCSVVVSFGSLRTTISRPGTMSHASVPESLRERLAPPPGLLRLSVGTEEARDLIDDLLGALAD